MVSGFPCIMSRSLSPNVARYVNRDGIQDLYRAKPMSFGAVVIENIMKVKPIFGSLSPIQSENLAGSMAKTSDGSFGWWEWP